MKEPDGTDFGKDKDRYRKLCGFDKDAALEHWEKGLKELGISKLRVELLTSPDEQLMEIIEDQLESTLPGLDLVIRTVTMSQLINLTMNGDFELVSARWGADYPDANSFLSLFYSKGTMDYGSYENEGFSPVGYSAFDKFSLGWLDLEEVGTPADYTLHEIGTEPDPANGVHTAYRLSTPYDNIYFIMENRQKTGWYRYSATEGMLVTAVNYNASNWNNNTINVSTKRLYSVNADNDNNRKTNAGDLFPYGDEDSLTTAGSPSLSIDGTVPYYSLYGIRSQNGLVTFTASSKMPTRVQENADSDVEININDGVLTVSAPCGSRLSVHDLSGHAILETVMTEPTFQTVLPEHGVWLIKCGNKTRKVRN